jgi:hypothetical protein
MRRGRGKMLFVVPTGLSLKVCVHILTMEWRLDVRAAPQSPLFDCMPLRVPVSSMGTIVYNDVRYKKGNFTACSKVNTLTREGNLEG